MPPISEGQISSEGEDHLSYQHPEQEGNCAANCQDA